MSSIWLSVPTMEHEGSIEDIKQYIPLFERRPFSLNTNISEERASSQKLSDLYLGINPNYDVIVRKPRFQSDVHLPIGIVSKQYNLVQHQEILERAVNALLKNKIEPKSLKVKLMITQNGERMRLSFIFPEEYHFDPGDKYPIALQLECFNSVEGSSRFMAVLGWLRFICSNGMIVGTVKTDFRRRHTDSLNPDDIEMVLNNGIKAAKEEKRLFGKWFQKSVPEDTLTKWVDGKLKNKWGVKAASRAYHIAKTGYDIEIANPFEKSLPSSKTVTRTSRVPGSTPPADNVYAISQVLSWLARERNDVQEQLAWKEDIPDLMKPLLS